MTKTLIACALLLGALTLSSCDYPEAGFYELRVLSGGKASASLPFMIEELTDDTDLTTGFNILVPKDGELVVVPMANGKDYSKRSWDIRVGAADSGYGDVQLTLVHANEQLTFSGTRRDPDATQSVRFSGGDLWDFSGRVDATDDEDKPAYVKFDGSLPASFLGGKAIGATWEVRSLTQAQFEQALGRPLKGAPRRDEPYLSPLRQPQSQTKSTTVPLVRPGRYKKDNPGGGRVGP